MHIQMQNSTAENITAVEGDAVEGDTVTSTKPGHSHITFCAVCVVTGGGETERPAAGIR